MERLRVGIDCRYISYPDALYRGIGRYSLRQTREVMRLEPESEFLLFTLPGADTSILGDAPNARVVTLPDIDPRAYTPLEAVRVAAAYQDCIADHHLDLFHITTPLFALERSFLDLHVCPTVVTHHDLIFYVLPEHYLQDPTMREMYVMALNLVVRQADAVVANSEWSKRELNHHLKVDLARIYTAYPAPEPAFHPLPKLLAHERLRAAGLQLPEQFLLCVSALHYTKNLETLLAGYARLEAKLRQEYPLVLTFALSAQEHERLAGLLRELRLESDVIVTGGVSDEALVALYNLTSLYVHPSRYEGFGMPVIEAMACGAPVLTTTAASLPEAAGDAGVLIDPESPLAFTESLHDLLIDERRRIELSARSLRWSATFTGERFGERTLTAYRTAARKSAVPYLAAAPAARPAAAPAPNPESARLHVDIPEPISGVHLADAYESVFTPQLLQSEEEFDQFRLRSDRSPWGRLPVIGFFMRILIRMRNLGRVWGAQQAFYTLLIRRLGQMEWRINDLSQLNDLLTHVDRRQTALSAEVVRAVDAYIAARDAALDAKIARQAETMRGELHEALDGINARIQAFTDLHLQLQAGLTPQVDSLREHGEALEALRARLQSLVEQADADAEAVRARLEMTDKRADDLAWLIDDRADKANQRMDGIEWQIDDRADKANRRADDLAWQIDDRADKANRRADDLAWQIDDRADKANQRMDGIEWQIDDRANKANQRADDLAWQIDDRADKANRRMDGIETAQAATNGELRGLDERLRVEVSYRRLVADMLGAADVPVLDAPAVVRALEAQIPALAGDTKCYYTCVGDDAEQVAYALASVFAGRLDTAENSPIWYYFQTGGDYPLQSLFEQARRVMGAGGCVVIVGVDAGEQALFTRCAALTVAGCRAAVYERTDASEAAG